MFLFFLFEFYNIFIDKRWNWIKIIDPVMESTLCSENDKKHETNKAPDQVRLWVKVRGQGRCIRAGQGPKGHPDDLQTHLGCK